MQEYLDFAITIARANPDSLWYLFVPVVGFVIWRTIASFTRALQ
jgi:hypothetical protein